MRSLKDLSSVVSTMMYIINEYPLCVSKDLAMRYQIPNNFLHKNDPSSALAPIVSKSCEGLTG